jgi:hypothetical protein
LPPQDESRDIHRLKNEQSRKKRILHLEFDFCAWPMFLLIPVMLRGGFAFWPALVAGCGLTFALYLLTAWVAGQFGVRL